MSLTQNSLAWLGLELVCYANRITPEMSAYELREALQGIIPGSENLTISRNENGNQIVTIGDKTLEVGPMASNDEIILALQNPWIKTENTKMAITGQPGVFSEALGRIKQRRAQTEAKFAAVASKAESTFNELDKTADAADKEIDAALHELAQHTNGAE